MIVIIGLILLIAAVVVGVAAIVTNVGGSHELTEAFKVFGYHMTGSTGMLFLFGVIVGAVAVLGVSLLLGGLRRTSRRGAQARRGLKESRREATAARQDRDDLIDRRDTGGAEPVNAREEDPRRERPRGSNAGSRHRRHLFGHRTAHR
ncbi:hypothetical protein [Streptomyces sp. NPDC093589]|uniref:hypothetical protein n=1 Tax=Streptomyces sp. NPDC093589 TaxID=3366043 RepID=UPI00382F6A90